MRPGAELACLLGAVLAACTAQPQPAHATPPSLMYCGPDADAAEQAYFDGLAGTDKFGFVATELVLTGIDGGTVRTLWFERPH